MKRYILALLLMLLASPAFAQGLPVCNWGDMIYRAISSYQCVPYDNTAGKFLMGQGASAAPVWTFQAHQNFVLPTQSTNTFLGNTTGGNASPTPNTVSQILDTIGYDIARPPTAHSIIYKSAVAPNNAWQALYPGTAGQTLTSGGSANPPYWATPAQASLDAICTTVGAIIYYQAPAPTSSWVCLSPGTANQALLTGGAGANPSWGNVVLPTRAINTTAPLTGGGDLTADRTLACATCVTPTLNTAALTKVDDTNVTLTLGGSPGTALVNAASITAGWTGTLAAARLNANVVQAITNDTNVTGSIATQTLTLGWTGTLAMTRGGTGASLTASNGGIVWTDANSMEVLAGTATARQMLQSGATATPAWSTATWPATTTVSRILYSSSNNVVGEITTANRGVVNTDGSGVPSVTATPTLGVNGGTGGQITLNGSTSGSAVIKVAAAAGTTNFQLPVGNGSSGNVLQTDGSGNTSWAASAGSGDVTAAANFGTDNVAIRSDGTGKGVQSTGVGIDDSNNVTGVNSIAGSVIATAAQQETATSAINVVTPSVQQRHPSATKAWARCDAAGGTSLAYNASCSRTGVGEYLMTFTTAFSNTSFPCLCTLQSTNHTCATSPASTTTATVSVRSLAPAAADSIFSIACFGDQ